MIAAGLGTFIMHILMVTVAGLILLAIMHFGLGLLGQPFAGAKIFIGIWLVLAIANGLYGHFRAGIPIINEIGAFIPIFGIPALIAWYLMRRSA